MIEMTDNSVSAAPNSVMRADRSFSDGAVRSTALRTNATAKFAYKICLAMIVLSGLGAYSIVGVPVQWLTSMLGISGVIVVLFRDRLRLFPGAGRLLALGTWLAVVTALGV